VRLEDGGLLLVPSPVSVSVVLSFSTNSSTPGPVLTRVRP
jgi:hypothetical protein